MMTITTRKTTGSIHMTSNSMRSILTFCTFAALAGFPAARVASAQEPAPAIVTDHAAADDTKTARGTIVGVVRNPARLPVSDATVTATRLDDQSIRSVISGSDGMYSFSDVVPGTYLVTTQAEGYVDKEIASVLVTAGHPTRIDIPVVSVAAPPVTISGNAPVAAPATAATVAPKPAGSNEIFLNRWVKELDQAYAARAAKTSAAAATSPDSAKVASLGTPPVAALDRPTPEPQAAAPAAPEPAKTTSVLPDALSAPEPPPPGVDNFTPFAFGDFSWMNATTRNSPVLDTKFFTPEIRFDTNFMEDFNQPHDHTIVGATESFRSGEVQLEQISVGGDFHWQNVRGRILTMDGLFATTTPRNDASSATGSGNGNTGGVGQWDLQNAYKYVSEAWGGYHFNVQHGLNVDAGIFVSYIGLFSYYNFDNWTYQPSYVSSNTPWFFNGVRIQWFPTNKLKIEPWIVNGWQSYAKFNGHLGLGGQLLWQPHEWLKIVANQYGYGQDNLGLPKTERIHTDDSIEVRYYNNPNNGKGISKMAFTGTGDLGVQYGGGICGTCGSKNAKDAFLGYMFYDRTWFDHDLFGLTIGGGQMSNPGRYLTLLPPINGAWAASGTPYFTENPGQPAHMWDGTVTLQYMPKPYITWWLETGYRHSDIPYFAGRGGVTPPGGDNGSPQYYTCAGGSTAGTNNLAAAEAACGGGASSLWYPDLRHSETKVSVGLMVKF
jgi:Putative beta-barrel porin-2, OmpL-like. bbp2/Carboxypeptidase regulatory-like domain